MAGDSEVIPLGAVDPKRTLDERSAAIRGGDDALVAAAREIRVTSRGNDAAFWAEADRRREVRREAGVAASPEAPSPNAGRTPAGPAAEFVGGGELGKRGVRRETLWDGPFDLDWVLHATNEAGGLPAAAGTEVLRSADPTGTLRRVVLVGSAEEGIAHAQFDMTKAKTSVYIAIRGDLTPQVQMRLARYIGAVVGPAGRPRDGVEVVFALPASARDVEKLKAVRVSIPAAVVCASELPPAGRRSWADALAVMNAGRTPDREKARGSRREQGAKFGMAGPGAPT